MIKFKYKFFAKLYLVLVNLYIPILLKFKGKILLKNGSRVFGINGVDGWFVYKAFYTQEMIDSLIENE
jgi:hypothetical protein